jgi:hypothetical protein
MFDFWPNEPKWGILLTFYAKKKKLKKNLIFSRDRNNEVLLGFQVSTNVLFFAE